MNNLKTPQIRTRRELQKYKDLGKQVSCFIGDQTSKIPEYLDLHQQAILNKIAFCIK